jgi:hypothetical protein
MEQAGASTPPVTVPIAVGVAADHSAESAEESEPPEAWSRQWSNLAVGQHDAARLLGWTEESWDEMPGSLAEMGSRQHIMKHLQAAWLLLSPHQRNALDVLGMSQGIGQLSPAELRSMQAGMESIDPPSLFRIAWDHRRSRAVHLRLTRCTSAVVQDRWRRACEQPRWVRQDTRR